MRAMLLNPRDTSYLDELLLDQSGHYRLHPARDLLQFPLEDLIAWANLRARYVLPTVELVECLRELISGRRAIEIGAGMGDLGYHLDIPMTDSYIQTEPDMKAYYHSIFQEPTNPPAWVVRLDAEQALEAYRPQVILAAFVTQRYEPGDEREPKIGSSIHGHDEVKVIREVETYIHVGNEETHKDKRALRRKHRAIHGKWIITRAFDQTKNVIWVWEK